jgi:heptosyltransferase-2
MNGKRPVFFIVKNRALGDSIMGLSTVQYLRELYPDSRIIYAVPAWIAPLYKNVQTAADEIYSLKLNSLSDILDLFSYLTNEKVDAIHEMHQSGRGKKIFSLFSFFSRIKYTFHNHHLESGTPVHDQGAKKELIQRDLDGLYSFYGKEKPIPQFLNFSPVIQLKNKPGREKKILLGVVATRETKMWPLKNYAELAMLISKSHPDYKIVIPLSKSEVDTKIKNELQMLGLPANATIVHWSLDNLAEEFAKASLYVGNDTGIKHLAISVGVKTFTFFGPEPVREWHPYDAKVHPYFYRENLPCRTRTHHYCGLSVCDLHAGEHMQCLTYFSPEKVFKEIENYM